MNTVKVDRCYFPGYNPDCYNSLNLHVFIDAGEEAYAAAAYFRVVDNGRVRCILVSSKTKVAPLQPLSIPRLELQAAVLGARLRKTIEQKHSLKIQRTFFWSDSSTVIAWIKSDARRYRQFVAFRVNEILSLSSVQEWRWVPTKLNVADEATKWGKGPSFDPDSRWYRGPKFLYDSEHEWPRDCREENSTTAEELRSAFVHKHHVIEQVVKRFSRLERLLRSMAYVVRFIDNGIRLIREKPLQLDALTTEELQNAERCLWRIAQSDEFPDEVAVFKHNLQSDPTHRRKLDRNSPLKKLTPAIDEFNVLRVDGRIQEADFVDYDTRNPIILPRGHPVTDLLLDWYHRKIQHANDETVVNEVRQRFYIPKLRVQVRLVRKRCMWCRVYKAAPAAPRMGPLPKARLMPFHRPFTMVGIDLFGPYIIRPPTGRSSLKRWVVLFTCLTTRAVHLEIAANLSTDSCKKAIRRFIGRRGAPLEIYSDNGTNFVGASRELVKEIKIINKDISSTFTDTQTQWRFNPPSAPHMGGCWERMVRSVKAALGALPTVRTLDEESFATVLVEAEFMVNSRPLTFVPLETAEHESLTPNHFLLLSSPGVRQPIKTPVDEKAAIQNSWNMIQNTLDQIWRRWVNEYLPTITRRTKWFENIRPIREGELVVLVDNNVRNRWLRGRVVRTYPGKDGTVRRVDVQTSGGIISRPVIKLAVLDVKAECDAEAGVLATQGGEC
ncbi:uncharacterized protein LOC129774105 [Toxorhynchites rutilus septentrionalis]|uniref:uncharacterized protein LOC129774105 n=1 Tax=Toxorhynchites rutilus septentrionalis TaxID=329112 RepID=UPI00247AE668|nr:uncharacterized protein LOC129774105 [Toxorhynchites rutilus septentrionalis]